MSMPPPIPTDSSLSYATVYVDTRRPGVIVAMGVTSIVLAVLFAFSAAMTVLMSIGIAAGNAASVAASQAPATPQVAPTPNPNGLARSQRDLIRQQIASSLTLTPARRDVLDVFLVEEGQRIALNAKSAVTPSQIAKLIDGAGVDSSADGPSMDFISFTGGRLSITDTAATFEPAGTTDLNAFDYSKRVPAPGAAGFDAELSGDPFALAVGTAVPTVKVVPMTQWKVHFHTLGAVASGFLSILLLAAGICLVRAMPLGRRLHLWWAGLKTLTAITMAIATTIFYEELMRTSAGGGGGANSAAGGYLSGAIMIAAIAFFLSMIYPVAVFIVMMQRSVRNYLATAP